MIVLDVILPKIDGYEVLRVLKSDPETREIGVILLTVLDQDGAVSHGMELGADWYVPKPFVPGDIATLVRRFLQSSRCERCRAGGKEDRGAQRICAGR